MKHPGLERCENCRLCTQRLVKTVETTIGGLATFNERLTPERICSSGWPLLPRRPVDHFDWCRRWEPR